VVAWISWRLMAGVAVLAVPMMPGRDRPEPVMDEPVEAAAAVDDDTRKAAGRFTGSYKFAGGDAERAARDAAIEAVVEDMNMLAQPIARSKLQEGNKIAERLDITLDGDAVSVAFDGRPFVASLDGSKKRVVGITGDELDYHVEVGASKLRQVFKGDKGGRSNAMRRSGKKIAIDVKVTSSKLPKPLQYRLTYAPH
jgi:hypothetical protein